MLDAPDEEKIKGTSMQILEALSVKTMSGDFTGKRNKIMAKTVEKNENEVGNFRSNLKSAVLLNPYTSSFFVTSIK